MAQSTTAAGPLLTHAPVAVTITTQDLDKCIEFYTNHLGLKCSEQTDAAATFECGNGTSIYAYVKAEAPKATNTVAAFMVDDLDACIKSLSNNGVKFQDYDLPELATVNHIATMPDGQRVAWCTDPDGNILGIGTK